MEDENEILKRRVEELETSLASLERRMYAFEAERELPTSHGAAIHHSSHPPVPTPRPFEVNYDPDAEEYYIFAPPGCVLVNGVAVEIKDVDPSDHTVALDLDPEDLPDSLWAHVTESLSATGGYKVEFDDEETKSGAKWNFRVMRFGAAENDGNQYDLCASVVCIDAPPPGNFEPMFKEDQSDHKVKLDDVGQGFCPFGRVFYENVTVDSSAKIETGYIYLEVIHPASASSNVPTIYVKGNASQPAFDNTNDTSKSLIPLYYIDGGRITIDFRSCMSLTIREL